MVKVRKNCVVREDPQAKGRLKPILVSMQTIKVGNWFTNKTSGLPGTISNIKTSKTGKHGHAKFTFNVSYPFTGQTSQEMHPGHSHVTQPEIKKYELFVTAYDPFNEEDGRGIDDDDDIQTTVTCLNEANEERFVEMHPYYRQNEGTYEWSGPKFVEAWAQANDEGKEMVLSIVEGPIKQGDDAQMCFMIEKWQLKEMKMN